MSEDCSLIVLWERSEKETNKDSNSEQSADISSNLYGYGVTTLLKLQAAELDRDLVTFSANPLVQPSLYSHSLGWKT